MIGDIVGGRLIRALRTRRDPELTPTALGHVLGIEWADIDRMESGGGFPSGMPFEFVAEAIGILPERARGYRSAVHAFVHHVVQCTFQDRFGDGAWSQFMALSPEGRAGLVDFAVAYQLRVGHAAAPVETTTCSKPPPGWWCSRE